MLYVFFIILLLYIFLVLGYAIGWAKTNTISSKRFSPSVSVVIALRNEEKNIANLLSNLQSQIYPIEKVEIVLVNDHSLDNTLSLLNKISLPNLKVINLNDDKSGEKDAISMGVSLASGEIILASDADCSFTPNWIQTMISYFVNDNVKLVSGPVLLHKQDGVFQALQSLEFLSLIGSGAGAIGINNPIFCNGANMAYRRDIFLKLNSYKNSIISSGDDVFLLHSVKQKYSNSILFAKNENAIVRTNSMQNLSSFINQRKRWVAKTTGYEDRSSVYASYLVLLTNLSLIFLFGMFLSNTFYFQFFILFYTLKFISDLFLLSPVLIFFNRNDLIKWILPFELFYSFYIIFIVILSFIKKFEWKGRMLNK